MKITFENVNDFKDLAQVFTRQEDYIDELKKENYELLRDNTRLRSSLSEFKELHKAEITK